MKKEMEVFSVETLIPALRNVTLDASVGLAASLTQSNSTSSPHSDLIPAKNEYGKSIGPRHVLALRELFADPKASFRTQEQMQMIDLVLRREHHGLIVIPTGSGKSLSALLPALLEDDGITVFILPFVGLVADMKKRLASYPGIRWGTFPQDGGDLDNLRLLIVQIENATRESSFNWFQQAASCGKIKRIIVDEIHLTLSDFVYRDSIRDIRNLTAINVPFILLSATLSPSSENAVCEAVGLPPASVHIVRASTTLPSNVSYRFRRCVKQDISAQTMDAMQGEFRLKDDERGIIWFNNIFEGETFCSMMKIAFAKGGLDSDKYEILKGWQSGTWIGATSCLSHGIDYGNIVICIHYNSPPSMMLFMQENGRLGRDGRAAVSLTIHDSPSPHPPATPEDHEGVAAMRNALVKPQHCRRSAPSLKFDGTVNVCFTTPHAELCDLCESRMVSSSFISFFLIDSFNH